MKIAIASSNGEDVDLHFGKASSLYIYDYDDETEDLEFIEKREVEIEEDERHQWSKILAVIWDCDLVVCVQTGVKSKIGIKEAGLKVLEDEGSIDDVLKRYFDHLRFMRDLKI